MYTIETGVQITRRKFVHILRDPAGETVWTARSIGEILSVCTAQEINQVELYNGTDHWKLVFTGSDPEEG